MCLNACRLTIDEKSRHLREICTASKTLVFHLCQISFKWLLYSVYYMLVWLHWSCPRSAQQCTFEYLLIYCTCRSSIQLRMIIYVCVHNLSLACLWETGILLALKLFAEKQTRSLPKSLQNLIFGSHFNQDLRQVHFPPCLETLHLEDAWHSLSTLFLAWGRELCLLFNFELFVLFKLNTWHVLTRDGWMKILLICKVGRSKLLLKLRKAFATAWWELTFPVDCKAWPFAEFGLVLFLSWFVIVILFTDVYCILLLSNTFWQICYLCCLMIGSAAWLWWRAEVKGMLSVMRGVDLPQGLERMVLKPSGHLNNTLKLSDDFRSPSFGICFLVLVCWWVLEPNDVVRRA